MLATINRVWSVAWGQAWAALIALASIRLFTELMDPSRFGVAMLCQGILVLVDGIGIMALNQTALAFAGRLDDVHERRNIALALAWKYVKLFGPPIVFASVAACIYLMIYAKATGWVILPLLAGIYVIFEALKVGTMVPLTLARQYQKVSSWLAFEATGTLALTSVLLAFWRADALGFLTGYILSRAATTCISVPLISIPKRKYFVQGLELLPMREVLQYGLPVSAMGPLGWVSTYLDRYALGATLGPAATGIYGATTGLAARPFGLVTSVLTNYFRPLFYRVRAGEDGSRAYRHVLHKWMLSACVVGLIGVLLAYVLGDELVSLLLAPEYREGAVSILVLFAIAQTLTITTHATDNGLLAMGVSGKLLKMQIILALATLLLIPAGALLYGILGALIGRVLAEAIKASVVYGMARRMITDMKKPLVSTATIEPGTP